MSTGKALIKYLEGKLKPLLFPVITGSILVGSSFLLINLTGWTGILLVATFFLTL